MRDIKISKYIRNVLSITLCFMLIFSNFSGVIVFANSEDVSSNPQTVEGSTNEELTVNSSATELDNNSPNDENKQDESNSEENPQELNEEESDSKKDSQENETTDDENKNDLENQSGKSSEDTPKESTDKEDTKENSQSDENVDSDTTDDETTSPENQNNDSDNEESTEESNEEKKDVNSQPETDSQSEEGDDQNSDSDEAKDLTEKKTEVSSEAEFMAMMMSLQSQPVLVEPNLNQAVSYMYVQFDNGDIYKVFPLSSYTDLYHYEKLGRFTSYNDIASVNGELYGIKSSTNKISDNSVVANIGSNSLTYDGVESLYYIKGSQLYSYNLNSAVETQIMDTGYNSLGDLVFFNNKLYYLGYKNSKTHLLSIDLFNSKAVNIVRNVSGYAYGLAVCDNTLYVCIKNVIKPINVSTGNWINSGFEINNSGNIYGAAQATDNSGLAYLPGKVYSQHYTCVGLTPLSSNSSWRTISLDNKDGLPVIKNSKTGDSNSPNKILSKSNKQITFIKPINSINNSHNAQKVFGYLIPSKNVTSIRVQTDDGVRVFIDQNGDDIINQSDILIDKFFTQSSTTYTTNVQLVAQKAYKYQLDYFNWGGASAFYFEYKDGNTWRQIPDNWWNIKLNMQVPFKNTPPQIKVNPADVELSYNNTSFTVNQGVEVIDAEEPNLTFIATPSTIVLGNNTDSKKEYLIQYTAEDSYGKKASATRKVTILPNQAPYFVIDQPVVKVKYKDTFDTNEIWNGVTAYDTDGTVISKTHNIPIPIDTFTENTSYTINYVAVDNENKEGYATKTIQILANSAPVVNVASGVNTNILYSTPSVNLLEGVSASDDEDGVLNNVTAIPSSIDTTAPTGNTGINIQYSVSDLDGKMGYGTRNYVVLPNNNPVLTFDEYEIEVGEAFDYSYGVNLSDIEDDAFNYQTTYSVISGSVDTSVIGEYKLIYKAVDSANAFTEVERTVYVVDKEAPEITFDEYPPIKLGYSGAINYMAGVHVKDNYNQNSDIVVTYVESLNTNISGIQKVTYTAKDKSNNTIQVQRSFVINTPPNVSVNNSHIYLYYGQQVNIMNNASYSDVNGYDLNNVNFVADPSTINTKPSNFGPKVYTVTYTATDSLGDSDSDKAFYHVYANKRPTIIANDLTVEYGSNFTLSDAELGVTVSDYEDNELQETTSLSISDTDVNNVNTLVVTTSTNPYLITYIATDSAGLESLPYTRKVFVTDTVAPVISNLIATVDIVVDVNNSQLYGKDEIIEDVNASDIIDGDIGFTYSITKNGSVVPSIDTSVLGTYTIKYSAKDKHNNQAITKTRVVNVVDTIAPSLSFNQDYPVIKYGASALSSNDYLFGAVVSDNYDDSSKIIVKNLDTVNTYQSGVQTVNYSARDLSGNVYNTSRDFYVNTKPTISVVKNNVNLFYGQTVTLSDNVSINDVDSYDINNLVLTTTPTSINTSPSNYLAKTYTVTYKVEDTLGDYNEVSAQYHVAANNKPVIDAATQTVAYKSNYNDTVAMAGVTVTDVEDDQLIGINTTVTYTTTVNTLLPGTYQTTYTAIDSAGQLTEFVREVIVEDKEIPVITNTLTEVILSANVNSYTNADIIDNTTVWAEDPDDGIIPLSYSIEFTPLNGVSSTVTEVRNDILGEYVITYTASDVNGNLATPRTRVIKVIDNVKPVLTIYPSARYIKRNKNVANYLYGVSVIDNYDTDVTITHDGPLAFSTVGKHTVTYTATDDFGNVTTATRIYDVYVPYTPPYKPPTTEVEDDEEVIIDDEETPLGTVEYYEPYIFGYVNKTFRPHKNVTRAEIASMFARILKLDLSSDIQSQYSDVIEGDWFYRSVNALAKLNLMNEYNDGTFRPNQAATRAEVAYLFSQYWKHINVEVSTEADFFTDIEGHWAEDYINQVHNAGVMNGFNDKTFRPDTAIKREQVVKIINLLLGRPLLYPEKPSFPDVDVKYWAFGDIEAATVSFNKEVKPE